MAGNKYETIIVGGGIAGLTAATYLAKANQRVLLIEKNKECGGLVGTFSRDGFKFEVGVRSLLNAGIIFPMLQELELSIDVVKNPVSVGLENKILHIKDLNSLEEYGNMLMEMYPESRKEINGVIRIIHKVMKDMDVLYGIDNPNFKDISHDKNYLFKQLLPWLPKFLFTIGRINKMNKPVEPYLEKFIKDRSLLDIITQHFFRNTPAFFALSYFSLYLDYFYPLGGVGQLVSVLENRLLELGGEIRKETTINSVIANDHIIFDHNNVEYSYDQLIWAADLKTLYRITDTGGLSKKLQKKIEGQKNQLLSKRGGDSVYTLYLEVDIPTKKFGEISNGHFFYTPSRKGLGETHWSELDALLEKGLGSDKSKILDWLNRFLSLNTYEISIPSLRDPTMSPEGKTGLIVSILSEYDLFRMIADAGWYEEFIAEMENSIIRILTDSVYPMLEGKVMKRFSFSPLSYEKRVGSSEGAIIGWSFRETVPSINKIQQSNRAVITPIPSIYQAGQWTYSPAGVPMSILTGKLAANRVLQS
jgi:phytoene dehydrogenase-like protein